MWEIINGDCLEAMRGMADNSVDSVVTDPPYGLAFMGKRWDYDVPGVDVWREALRVLKPGGHLLAFAGTRTQHRMACRIEDAGFEIRDMIAWCYGSGFPKSLDVSKAIDAAAGAEREVVGYRKQRANSDASNIPMNASAAEVELITAPATEAAKQWSGWGTALKPSLEPITLARKPLIGTVAANVLQHGTGALNVDGCMVGSNGGTTRSEQAPYAQSGWRTGHEIVGLNLGRWPANLIHDGSDEVTGLLGDAARFFYCPKASKADRDDGCGGMELRGNNRYGEFSGNEEHAPKNQEHNKSRNHHPTVKPTDLMRYLCKLVTPPGGLVLDPFAGSGSTGRGAVIEGFRFVGIELDSQYAEIARARIASANNEPQEVQDIDEDDLPLFQFLNERQAD